MVTLQVSSNVTTHEIITSYCREDEKLSTGGKIFSKYCDMSKNARERIHQPFFPLPSCTTVVVCLCVYVRGYLIHLSVRSLLTRARLLPLIRTRPLINRLIEKLCQKSSIEGNESAILGMKPMGQATKSTHQLELANLPNVQHWSALRLLIDLTARSHWKF